MCPGDSYRRIHYDSAGPCGIAVYQWLWYKTVITRVDLARWLGEHLLSWIDCIGQWWPQHRWVWQGSMSVPFMQGTIFSRWQQTPHLTNAGTWHRAQQPCLSVLSLIHGGSKRCSFHFSETSSADQILPRALYVPPRLQICSVFPDNNSDDKNNRNGCKCCSQLCGKSNFVCFMAGVSYVEQMPDSECLMGRFLTRAGLECNNDKNCLVRSDETFVYVDQDSLPNNGHPNNPGIFANMA